jgi:hypothetical protein
VAERERVPRCLRPFSPLAHIFSQKLAAQSVGQSGFVETLPDPVEVCAVVKRQPAQVIREGILWIYVLQFIPDSSRFIDLAKVAEC